MLASNKNSAIAKFATDTYFLLFMHSCQCFISASHTAMDEVLTINADLNCKAKDKHNQSFPILQVHIHGTVRMQCGCVTECINIVRFIQCFK